MRRTLPFLLLAACSGGSSHPQHPLAPADAAVAHVTPPDATPAPAGESLATAGLIPDWMDPTADPCQDFFQYACGGLMKQDIPADLPAWGAGVQQGREIEELLKGVLEKDTGKLGNYYTA